MIDLEGPSEPQDKDGNRYAFTYVCCLCHGVLLEKSALCNAREARRMFASCVFRSGRFPIEAPSSRMLLCKNIVPQSELVVGLEPLGGQSSKVLSKAFIKRLRRF